MHLWSFQFLLGTDRFIKCMHVSTEGLFIDSSYVPIEVAVQVKEFAVETSVLNSVPSPTWGKERTDIQNVSSGLHDEINHFIKLAVSF